MNTTAHPVAPEEVMAFLDGELCATDAQAISTHLEHCAECTAIAEQFRTTSEKLTSWTVDVLPPSLEETILKDSKGEKRSSSKALRKLIFQLPFRFRSAGDSQRLHVPF